MVFEFLGRARRPVFGISFALCCVLGACTEKPPEVFLTPTGPNAGGPSPTPGGDGPAGDGGDAAPGALPAAEGGTNPDPLDASVVAGEAGSAPPGPDAEPAPNPSGSDSGAGPSPAPDFAVPSEADLVERCGAAPVSEGEFTRRALRDAAGQCASWQYCRFQTFAEVLNTQTQAYAAEPDETALANVRAAWKAAMSSWSVVELFQFGPLGSRSDSAGKDMYEGQGIRDLVYAWPSTSRCRVEEQLISQNYATRGMDSALISGRGLFGLEYLLFYPGSDTECAATTVTAMEWSELSESELASRKRDYAKAIAQDVVARVDVLIERWSPTGGNFHETFVDAAGAYPDEQEVMKVLAWSLVYIERELKDWKVGIPAGHTLTHPVSMPEASYAMSGTANIRSNLRGFRSLFQGCGDDGEGLGFDDWLVEAGHPELAEDIIEAWKGAQAAADAFVPLHSATADQLNELYTALQALTSLLKNDFFGAGSPLNLELPGGVEGDTD